MLKESDFSIRPKLNVMSTQQIESIYGSALERTILAEQQGYDAVVNSCVSDPGLLEMRSCVDDPVNVIGVPVIDPMITAFKFAEMMVDLQAMAGYPPVSRIGLYKKQPADEFHKLRDYLVTHPTPEKFYIKDQCSGL